MVASFTPVDIGNRALQHVGAERITTSDFSENSKRCAEVAACYDKLRTAELERNDWEFAIKRVILRPIDTNTMQLSPSLWSGNAVYFSGSIVSDSTGNLWQSRLQNNVGFQPGIVWTAWEPYFGPLTVELYDPTASYFPDEVVYTLGGDGTYNVYLSLTSNNAVDPSLSNQWASTTTYFQGDVVQQFAAWASGTTYPAGPGVLYTDGNWYASLVAGNLNNPPPFNPTKWAKIPTLVLQSLQVPAPNFPVTPLTPVAFSPVTEWSITQTYGVGSFVQFKGSQYVSLQANNTGNFPNQPAAVFWARVTLGTLYQSLIDLNLGNSPANAALLWVVGTSYSIGNLVGGSDGYIYISVTNGNVGHNPTLDGGVNWTNTLVLNPWTTVFTQGGGNSQWLQIGGASFPSGVALAQLRVRYPAGCGPSSQSETGNVFRLPSGFLKKAPTNPKAGVWPFLGAPSGPMPDDWLFEGPYLVSHEISPLMLRFIADVTDVSTFHSMFCEGLAARIAVEVCEPLTQSTAKVQMIEGQYKTFMSEARLVNAILVGAEEPPTDDFISCRL
jgi:hypothetical protein